jgi:hypothetical protein
MVDPPLCRCPVRIHRSGRCAPYPGGEAALAAGLQCPTPADIRDPVTRFFIGQQSKQQQQLASDAAGGGATGAANLTLPTLK